MPGKVTAYKKIAKSVVDRCIASNTDVVKCILALFKDSFVSSKLKGKYFALHPLFAVIVAHLFLQKEDKTMSVLWK